MTTNTTSPYITTPGDYADQLSDLFRRVQIIEQQAAGIAGTSSNVFPGGIVIGTGGGGGPVTVSTAISSVTGLTTSGGAYLSYGYLDVSWTIPDATVAEVEIFYALKAISGGSYDIPRSIMVAGTGTRIQSLICGRTYGVYVVPRNILGLPGTATPAPSGMTPVYQDVTIPADSTVPPTLSGLVTNLGADTLIAAWTAVPSTELDVLDGGYYEAQLAIDAGFATVVQDWRGAANVMSFDGIGATPQVGTTLASTPLPAITLITNHLTTITAAVSGTNIFTLTLGAGHGVLANELVTLSGFAPPDYNGTWLVQSVTSTTIVLSAVPFIPGSPLNATTIGTGVNSTKWTYTFISAHGLSVGNFFDTTGFTPAGYNQAGQEVYTVPSATTLTVLNGDPLPGPITVGGNSGYGIKSNSQTAIKVASFAGFPLSGNYPIYNGPETMLVIGGQGSLNQTVTRGYNGTTAQNNAQIGSAVSTGPGASAYYLRVRAVSVGGIAGAWSYAAGGGAVPAGGVSGTDILARTVTAVQIVAGSITSNEIAANTITAGQIEAGTITAEQLGAIQLTVGQYIRSSNYAAGLTGWNMDQNGDAEFNNLVVRGTVVSSDIIASDIRSSTIEGTTITGGLVIGSVVETATSGQRIVMEITSGPTPHYVGGRPTSYASLLFYGNGTGAGDASAPAELTTGIDANHYTGLAMLSQGGTSGKYSKVELDSTGITVQSNQRVNIYSDSNDIVLSAGSGHVNIGGGTGISLADATTVDTGDLTISNGRVAMSDNIFIIDLGGNNNWIWSGGDTKYNFVTFGTLTGYTQLNASAYNIASDLKLKDAVKEVDNSHILHQLRPVTFKWKDTRHPGTRYGFIAQEVQQHFPDMVSDIIGPDNESLDLLNMNYTELIPLLLAEVQKIEEGRRHTTRSTLMPQVSVEQEIINRLQNQIGAMAGQMVIKDIHLDLLLQERDALQQIITALGGELPPSQVVKAGEANVASGGTDLPEDRGTGGGGSEDRASHQARPSEPELSHQADPGPSHSGPAAPSDHPQEDDPAA